LNAELRIMFNIHYSVFDVAQNQKYKTLFEFINYELTISEIKKNPINVATKKPAIKELAIMIKN
jgi:hypothetical protein